MGDSVPLFFPSWWQPISVCVYPAILTQTNWKERRGIKWHSNSLQSILKAKWKERRSKVGQGRQQRECCWKGVRERQMCVYVCALKTGEPAKAIPTKPESPVGTHLGTPNLVTRCRPALPSTLMAAAASPQYA